MARAGDVVTSLSLGQEVRFLRTAAETGGEVLRIEIGQEPGVIVPPHVHPMQEERFEVVDGDICLRVGRRKLRLGTGDSARVPPGRPHSFSASGDRPARVINELRPALATEDCLEETFAVDQAALSLPGRLRELAAIAHRYPREFLFYLPLVPWHAQHRVLSAIGRPLGASGYRLTAAARQGAGRGLGIYMNDELAAGVLWRETARRAARENPRGELGEALRSVADGITQDVALLEEIMKRLGIRRSTLKPVLAVAAERLGRLKLNGRLVGYSPLSRFAELDFLAIGIEGKKIFWANLRDLADLGERLADIDFTGLIERAQQQFDLLEPFRARAGVVALRAASAGRRSDDEEPAAASAPSSSLEPAAHDRLVARETEAAASAAGAIGGRVPHATDDPAMDPVYQAGGGEQEGWEAAEADLIENATHGEGGADPVRDAPFPEHESDRSGADYAESDQLSSTELTED